MFVNNVVCAANTHIFLDMIVTCGFKSICV